MIRLTCSALSLAALAFASAAALPAPPPAPPREPVEDVYFGTRIVDDYRYMESPGNPVFENWVRAEGRYARAVFDAMPARAAMAGRVSRLTGSFGLAKSYQALGGREFWLGRTEKADQHDLMVREGKRVRTLIDMAALRAAKGGVPMAIDYFQASPDGKMVAVGISEGGSEESAVSVYDVATGARIAGPVPRVLFPFMFWSPDGKLHFNQMPDPPADAPPIMRRMNSQAMMWDLKSAPVALIGGGASKVITPKPYQVSLVATLPGAKLPVAAIVNGVDRNLELWTAPEGSAMNGDTPRRRLAAIEDQVVWLAARDGYFYLLSRKDAPTFQVLAVPEGGTLGQARVVVPARPGRVIEQIAPARDGIYVLAREGLYSRIYRSRGPETELEEIPLPGRGSVSAQALFGDAQADGLTVAFESWTVPDMFLSWDPAARRFTDRGITSAPPGWRAADFEAQDLEAAARDGTKVPFSHVRQKRAKGPQPLLILAYGAYGTAQYPAFSPNFVSFLSEGISFGVCHVRGGGELGDAWWQAGKDALKPNSWRDLIACAETAIAKGLTTREQLFILGGSAGGITVGMAAAERPDLFAGVISAVPSANMLRSETTPTGPANVPEFGSVKTEQGFRNLLAMDAYHAVTPGKKMPPMLVTTGLNDSRVPAWEPAKYAARLRAANPENLVLLRVDDDGGHGMGATRGQTDGLFSDMIAFMRWRLNEPGWAPAE